MSKATHAHTTPQPAPEPAPYRLGRHPRRSDHPALLNADGTVAATFAYNATREHIVASLEHAALVLHADDTVTPDGHKPQEGGEIAAAFAANHLQSVTPKVIDVGKHLAEAERAYRAFDAVSFHKGAKSKIKCSEGRAILADRVQGLRGIIASTPAHSIADAAVLIAECLIIASSLEASEHSQDEVQAHAARIERMLLSALPHVAEAAGLDMAAMGWEEQEQLRLARYAGVGVQQ